MDIPDDRWDGHFKVIQEGILWHYLKLCPARLRWPHTTNVLRQDNCRWIPAVIQRGCIIKGIYIARPPAIIVLPKRGEAAGNHRAVTCRHPEQGIPLLTHFAHRLKDPAVKETA